MKVKKMSVLLLIVVSTTLAVIGQLSLKVGMNSIGKIELTDLISSKIFDLMKEKFLWIGLILYIISVSIWLVVLSQAELSFAYPLVAIGYVITAILSKIFFNENLTMLRLLGIVLIMLGVYFIISKV